MSRILSFIRTPGSAPGGRFSRHGLLKNMKGRYFKGKVKLIKGGEK